MKQNHFKYFISAANAIQVLPIYGYCNCIFNFDTENGEKRIKLLKFLTWETIKEIPKYSIVSIILTITVFTSLSSNHTKSSSISIFATCVHICNIATDATIIFTSTHNLKWTNHQCMHHKNVQLILHPVYRDDSCQMQAITTAQYVYEIRANCLLLLFVRTWFLLIYRVKHKRNEIQ